MVGILSDAIPFEGITLKFTTKEIRVGEIKLEKEEIVIGFPFVGHKGAIITIKEISSTGEESTIYENPVLGIKSDPYYPEEKLQEYRKQSFGKEKAKELEKRDIQIYKMGWVGKPDVPY